VGLPITIALQGLLLRRYLSGPQGLGRLRSDFAVAGLLTVLAVSAAAAAHPGSVLAPALVFTWTAGLVWVRRGWGAAYATTLGLGAAGLWLGLPGLVDLAVTVCLVGIGLIAALASVPCSWRPAGSWGRAVPAGLVGGGIGVLLIRATGPSWGGPALVGMLALFPALAGSLWAGRHQSRLWDVVPAALVARQVTQPGRAGLIRVAGGVVAGALARAVLATAGLSVVILAVASTADIAVRGLGPLLLALGGIGVVGVMASLFEGLGRSMWAVAVVASACGAELILVNNLGSGIRSAVIVPAAAAVVALWPIVHLLGDAGFSLTRSTI